MPPSHTSQMRLKQALIIISGLVLGLSLFVFSLLNESTFLGKLAREGAPILLIGSLLSGVYELFQRHDFLAMVRGTSDDILRALSISQTKESLGISEIMPDANSFDYTSIIYSAASLQIRLNDGRTWISRNEMALGERLRDKTKETFFFLTHPHSPMVNVLARVEDKSANDIKYKIRDSMRVIQRHANGNPRVKIYGHHLFNGFGAFLTESEAVITLYFASRGKKAVPLIKFNNIGDSRCFCAGLRNDFQELLADAEDITSIEPTGEWLETRH